MAMLKWHESGTREFQAGVSKVALFPMDNGVYQTGVAWNGVTSITENPSGADITDLYADDQKYASLQAAEKFGFGIEAYDYPDEFEECDGSKTVDNISGLHIGQQARKPFGLVYWTKIGDEDHPGLDKGHLLHIIYNSLASPSSRGYTTINENPDAITMSWDANSTPVPVEGYDLKDCSTITVDSTKFPKSGNTATNLEKLEEMIYGTDGTGGKSPTMPTPAQVIKMLKTGSLT